MEDEKPEKQLLTHMYTLVMKHEKSYDKMLSFMNNLHSNGECCREAREYLPAHMVYMYILKGIKSHTYIYTYYNHSNTK